MFTLQDLTAKNADVSSIFRDVSPGNFDRPPPITSRNQQKNVNIPTKKFSSPRIERLNREFE
jgi:hypothetical protein